MKLQVISFKEYNIVTSLLSFFYSLWYQNDSANQTQRILVKFIYFGK